MSFDAYVVAFGISRLLLELHLVETNAAYLVILLVGILDAWLLYRFFSGLAAEPELPPLGDRAVSESAVNR
jgi:membrane protein implicated in regulation of membrane protease activity